MRGHSDKTGDAAIGSVSKEWKKMAELAVRLREKNCNPAWAHLQLTKFTGIYKRLLTDPLEEVMKEAGR